ncbi:MAG TPA: threonine/serine exporter [Ruminococcaceae bacterium]|jgi:uncharacterized membrane protein YjjP (DUF1212 family)|nr:threonine/serine exporter [Oscillospiraceae bacterium]
MNYDDLIDTTAKLGYMLVFNGAEVYRAEESMRRIFMSYGAGPGEVFVIPTFLSVSVVTPEGRAITRIKRIPPCEMDLDKVEKLNGLCRRVCVCTPDVSYIRRELDAIAESPVFPFWVQTAAYAAVGFFFTLFYGGNFRDAAVAMLCGGIIKLVCGALKKLKVNSFFVNAAASFFAASAALFAAYADVYLNYDKIIIGALMSLVPGIAITEFMHDIIVGDLIAGLLRLAESLLTAAAIAVGAGAALAAMRMLMGV